MSTVTTVTTVTTEKSTKVVVGPVRLSYAHIWEPKITKDGKDKKYQTCIIIPKSDTASIKKLQDAIDAAKEIGKTKWGTKAPKQIKTPLRDGDEEKDDPTYENSYFLNCSSKQKPGILGINKQPIENPEDVYSGCWVYISLNMYPFDFEGSKGIGAGLNNILKWKDDAALAGRASAESDFADLEVSADADDLL